MNYERYLSAAVFCALTLSNPAVGWTSDDSVAPQEGVKPKVCIVVPDAQLGQGTSASVDPAGPVVSTMVAYLAGPAADVEVLQARVAVQFNVEATQKNCGFVLDSSVVHKKGGKGMSGLIAAAPALMSAVPFLGGSSGGLESYAMTQAASAAMQGAAAADAQQAQQEAMAAMSGVAQSNIKKGDQITLTYRLLKPGDSDPVIGGELQAKADAAGQDILSPLIEKMAGDVLNAALDSTI